MSKKIALVGNPNSGKTSIFNALTGLKQKVGNFPGITVDKKVGSIKSSQGEPWELIDLPGIYSLTPKSIDEGVTCEVLLDAKHEDHPSGVIIVLDSTNLKRNLVLATQVLDLGIPAMLVLNMSDLAEKNGLSISTERLANRLDVKVIHTSAKKKTGLDAIRKQLDSLKPAKRPFIAPQHLRDNQQDRLSELLPNTTFYAAFKLAVNVHRFPWMADLHPTVEKWFKTENLIPSELELREISQRHEAINALYQSVIEEDKEIARFKWSNRLDKWMIHPVFGWFILFAVFFVLFQAVFSLATYPMDLIDLAMSGMASWLQSVLPSGLFSDFLINGLWAGLGGVVIFIPQIVILFGFITLLEETGYMARVSFLNDRLLRKMGMSGKSIVSIVGGFACAVPAIMAARTIDNPKERLITIFITPLMSCSARLPVYIFLVGFIVPDTTYLGIINLQGLFMLGLYLLGIVIAGLIGLLMNKWLKLDAGSFLLELPSFQLPDWRTVGITMIQKGKAFVVEAGKIIVIISMVLWVLTSFGPNEERVLIHEKYASIENETGLSDQQTMDYNSELLQHSYAGKMGKFIEPAIEPLGFDWKIGIALISSFAAREVFVATMSVIYSTDENAADFGAMRAKLKTSINPTTGKPLMSIPTAVSLLMFYVFAMQCMSTIAIVKRETNGWKWPIIQTISFTLIAYIFSFASYQLLA